MDMAVVRLLIKKHKSTARYYLEEEQYPLADVLTYVKLHPAKMLHICTEENGEEVLEAYIPTSNPNLASMIRLAAKAKVYTAY